MAARYPISGAVYQWSRRVSNDPVGWFAGWFMLIGYIVSVAAIAIAMQSVLPPIWDGFQIVGEDVALDSPSGAANAILLGSVTIAICGAISSFGVTKMATITRIGVTFEILGVILLLALLFRHAERGPDVVLETNGVEGSGSYLWPFLASMLMAAYVMYGFDSAAELSEETHDPRRTAPTAITRCMLVSAVGGGLLILGTHHAGRGRRRPGGARRRRDLDLLGGPRHPGLGVSGDVQHGSRRGGCRSPGRWRACHPVRRLRWCRGSSSASPRSASCWSTSASRACSLPSPACPS